jgi:hypothetical protein
MKRSEERRVEERSKRSKRKKKEEKLRHIYCLTTTNFF